MVLPGNRNPNFICPPGTPRGGEWTDRLGTTCALPHAEELGETIGDLLGSVERSQPAPRAPQGTAVRFIKRNDEWRAEHKRRQAAGERSWDIVVDIARRAERNPVYVRRVIAQDPDYRPDGRIWPEPKAGRKPYDKFRKHHQGWIDRFTELKKDGKSDNESYAIISEEAGVLPNQVAKVIRRWDGFSPGPQYPTRPERPNEALAERNAEIQAAYEEGSTVRELVQQYGLTPGAIHNILNAPRDSPARRRERITEVLTMFGPEDSVSEISEATGLPESEVVEILDLHEPNWREYWKE